MTICRHELKQGRTSLIIWAASIALLLVICIFLFPDIKDEMGNVSAMFSSMGSFTKAFGMDRISFGEFSGYYAVECGNVLGLGGALFAALTAVSVLSREEREHTAEFLLTHPVSRTRVLAEKLAAVLIQLILLNALILLCSAVSIRLIGERPQWNRLVLLLYFLSLIANLSEKAAALAYLTPFSYADGADILQRGSLDTGLLAIGAVCTAAAVAAAFFHYRRKDIC